MDAIVAVYSDWGIGCGGTQPVVVPEDRRHFREITGSGTVIAGRKTLADFPGGRPLKGRLNIILTRSGSAPEGALCAGDAESAVGLARAHEPAFVIGGASVYRALLPWCGRVFVTKIFCAPESDVFFENLDESPEWRVSDRSGIREHEGVRYEFLTYERADKNS